MKRKIERVKRKRPENLDAYDLVLRALSSRRPADAGGGGEAAMPLLESGPDPRARLRRQAHGYLRLVPSDFIPVHGGVNKESHDAAIRHARAALSYGRDDATALALGGLVVSVTEHDRATAFEALEQALAISPSSSFALFCGATALAYAGEAERAIDWAHRALRISPFDRLNYTSYHALALGHFLRGRYDEAAHAARRAVQSMPSSSITRSVLSTRQARAHRRSESGRTASASTGPLL